MLVVVAGAEMFTGNTLIVMAWASGEVSSFALLRNWALVWTGNFAGAFATGLAVHFSGVLASAGGSVGPTAVGIATAKIEAERPWPEVRPGNPVGRCGKAAEPWSPGGWSRGRLHGRQ